MKKAYDCVRAARAKDRPTGLDFIGGVFSDFLELHGDRRFADDPSVVGGIAMLGDTPFTVIATERGKNTRERIRRNFGAPHPEGYRKALRLLKQAEKFRRPAVLFVDTSGAFCGIGAEERGQGQAIAENLMELSALRTPVLSVLIGEGGSGGALALAVADEVWMLENAVYSVISPEGCAGILWRDAKRAPEAAENLKLTAADVHALGVAERVFPEQDGNWAGVWEALAMAVRQWYDKASALSPEELVEARYRRLRAMGTLPASAGTETGCAQNEDTAETE